MPNFFVWTQATVYALIFLFQINKLHKYFILKTIFCCCFSALFSFSLSLFRFISISEEIITFLLFRRWFRFRAHTIPHALPMPIEMTDRAQFLVKNVHIRKREEKRTKFYLNFQQQQKMVDWNEYKSNNFYFVVAFRLISDCIFKMDLIVHQIEFNWVACANSSCFCCVHTLQMHFASQLATVHKSTPANHTISTANKTPRTKTKKQKKWETKEQKKNIGLWLHRVCAALCIWLLPQRHRQLSVRSLQWERAQCGRDFNGYLFCAYNNMRASINQFGSF